MEPNSDSLNLSLYLTKKRNRNSYKKKYLNIHYNIIINKASIFKIEKIKKNNFSQSDFTQTKIKFFKIPNFHTFNPLFKNIKQKSQFKKFQILKEKKNIFITTKISLFNLKKLKDSKPKPLK